MDERLLELLREMGLKEGATNDEAFAFFQSRVTDVLKRSSRKAGDPSEEGATATFGEGALLVAGNTDDEKEIEDAKKGAVAEYHMKLCNVLTLAKENHVSDEVRDQAIRENWSMDRVREEFVKDVQERSKPPVGFTRIEDEVDKFRRVACAGLAIRCKLGNAKDVDGNPMVANEDLAEARKFSGLRLQQLARMCLKRDGYDGDLDLASSENLFNVVTSFSSGSVTAGNSLAEILLNSLHKNLQAAYVQHSPTFLSWAGRRTVRDFRDHNDIRLGAFGRPSEIGPGGEFDHKSISDARESYSAKTYGFRFVMDRQTFVNDDLGAFTRIPGEMGKSMARDIDRLGYEVLVSNSGVGPTLNEDSKSLFNATHTVKDDGSGVTSVSNYETGAGSALSQSSLSTGRQLFRKVRGVGGELLNVVPDVLLVPPELETTALELMQSPTFNLAGGVDPKERDTTVNTHQGTHRVVVEPRLSTATNGTTAWYSILSTEDSLVFSTLEGLDSPTAERRDPTDVLGFGWIIYFDYGVNAVDWRFVQRHRGS